MSTLPCSPDDHVITARSFSGLGTRYKTSSDHRGCQPKVAPCGTEQVVAGLGHVKGPEKLMFRGGGIWQIEII